MNVLNKAADASWQRENILTNNIANVDTPGYKRRDLDFESTLKNELLGSQQKSLDATVSQVDLDNLEPAVYTDLTNYSYRLDGSNVDIDTEEVEFASEQIRYQGITAAINNEFNRMRAVLK